MRFRRGDIIWARVVHPETWWPGLISRIDNLGVSVSFFSIEKPRHLLESEICSFDDYFESLVKTLKCSTGLELLDHALKLIGRRVVSSLKCPCQYPSLESASATKRRRVASSFLADSVLGFVLGLAVSPRVEDSEFVYAVTVAAQLLVFRRFLVTQQNLSPLGTHSKVHSNLHCGKLLCLEAQKSDTSKLEVQPLPELQPKSGSWTLTKQTEVQSRHEMLVNLHSPGLDTYYIEGECLKTVKQNCLMFRKFSDLNIFNFQFRKCSSRNIGIQLAYPGCIKSLLCFEEDGDGGREIFGPHVPYMANTMNFTSPKRLHDQPADSVSSFKLQKAKPLFSMDRTDAYLQESQTDSKVFEYDASTPAPASSDHSFKFHPTMPWLLFDGEDTYLQRNRNTCEAKMFYASDIRMFQVKEENVFALDDNRTSVPVVKMQEPEASKNIVQDSGTFISVDYDTVGRITNCIQTENVKDDRKIIFPQPSAAESMLNCAIQSHSNIDGISKTSAVSTKHLQSELTTGHIQMELGKTEGAMSIEINRGLRRTAYFEDSCMDGKELCQSGTCGLSFKPLVVKKSVLGTLSNSKSLHIKFPKGFNLPSKEYLIKKFSRFGRVDPLKTTTFSNMGSAQVVFLHELDAMAAYRYQKREKSLFGAQILVWLGPFDHRRRRSMFQQSSPLLTGGPEGFIKSCLKKYNPHVKEDKKCTRKVRFTIETD